MAFKPVANSAVLDDTHVQVSDSRWQRIYNSNTTIIANVEIGSTDSNVVSTTMVGPGDSVIIDCWSHEYYISLNTDVETVYRTPVAGGDE